VGHRAGDRLRQHLLVDLLQVLDVETRLAGGVATEPAQEILVSAEPSMMYKVRFCFLGESPP
jgi:hypothetical protein